MHTLYFIDTHCHINIMVKNEFDTPLTNEHLIKAQEIVMEASQKKIFSFINVGTSVLESKNCILIAEKIPQCFAAIGIHPNDCPKDWKSSITELKKLLLNHPQKIVAIGECGLDFHYPEHDKNRQKDAFRSQIELALTHNLPLIIHTRKAPDETLSLLDEFKSEYLKGVIHCFSEDILFAQEVLKKGFLIGIGGPLTYPKNEDLRLVFKTVPLSSIILETDAPYLPPQSIRGKQNSPASIYEIGNFLAQLRNESIETIAEQTTRNAQLLFKNIT